MKKDLKAEEMALRIRRLGRISGQGIEAFEGGEWSPEESDSRSDSGKLILNEALSGKY